MAYATISTVQNLFKILYPEGSDVRKLIYATNPTLARIPKNTEFGGYARAVPVIFGSIQNTQSGSLGSGTVTYPNASFLVTRQYNYNVAQLTNEVFLASKLDKGVIIDQVKACMDLGISGLGGKLATQMFRKSTASVAQISSSATVNSTTVPVQLTTGSSAVLEYNMNLGFSATDGGTARTSSGAYVVYLDRTLDQIFCSATPGGSVAALSSLVTSVAAGDYIYINANDIGNGITGLPSWIPGLANVASNDSFFGQNRYKDTRLTGHYFDGSSSTLQDAIMDATSLVVRDEGYIDHIACSFKDFNAYAKTLQSSVFFTDVNVDEADVHMSFSAIKINTANGYAPLVPDRNCPVGTAYALSLNSWEMASLGELAQLFKSDGLEAIRDATYDNLNLRFVSYAQLICKAPGRNVQIKLPAI